MKNPSPADTGVALLVLLAAVSLALAQAPGGPQGFLVVWCDGSSYLVPAPGGSYIVVEFTHSVHKTPEIDVVEPGDVMRIRAVAFQEYGAGVPESPRAIGGSIEDMSGGFIVYQGGGYEIARSILYNLRDVIDPDISLAGVPVASGGCRLLYVEYMGLG